MKSWCAAATIGTVWGLSGCGPSVSCSDPEVMKTAGSIISESGAGKAIGLKQANVAISEVITRSSDDKKKNVTCEAKVTVSMDKELIATTKRFYEDDKFAEDVLDTSPSLAKWKAQVLKEQGLSGLNYMLMAAPVAVLSLRHQQVVLMISELRSKRAEIDLNSNTISGPVRYEAAVLEDKQSKGQFAVRAQAESVESTVAAASFVSEAAKGAAEKEAQRKAVSATAAKENQEHQQFVDAHGQLESLVARLSDKEADHKIALSGWLSGFENPKLRKGSNGKFDVGGPIKGHPNKSLYMGSDGGCYVVGFPEGETFYNCDSFSAQPKID
jgi:hypothetical protein